MIGFVRRHVRSRAQGDDGIALVVAIALIAIVGMLIASIIAVAIYESRSTGRDRTRSQAVMAAEQSVDAMMASIQGASTSTLPCGTLSTQSVSVASDQLTVLPTVQYFDQNGIEITDCVAIRTGLTRAYTAVIRAGATSQAISGQAPAARAVEMQVTLNPAFANDMDKAIFGKGGVTLANHADIYGQNGQPNADVYSDKDVLCNNNQNFYGSIYAEGNVRLEGSCWVAVNVHAGTNFYSQSGTTVNGDVLVANGGAQPDKNSSVGGQMLTSGTIHSEAFGTNRVCGTPASGKCVSGATVPPVPHQDFPIMNADAASLAQWAAAGYTVRATFSGSQCGMYSGTANNLNGKVDNVANWILTNLSTFTGPTIVISNCPGQQVKFQMDNANTQPQLVLPQNLVIFSQAGFNFSNKTEISSSVPGQDRNFYLIQPYNAVPQPCTSEGIALDNLVQMTSDVHMLMYSPCNIRKANNTTNYGQIYSAGTVQIHNKLTMFYEPLPVIGVTNSSSRVESYSVEISYKREDV